MPIKKIPTIRETYFVKDLVSLKDGGEAVMRNYNVKNKKVARTMASQMLKKPRIKEMLDKEMEKQGLTPEFIVDVLKENILAGKGVKATAETSNRGIEIYAKLTGAFNQENIEQTYKMKLSKLNSKELEMELTKINKYTSSLLSDIQRLNK